MKIKKFIAPSMREALLLIKQDLGEEAIILKTRKIPRKLLSLGGHDEIEVTAAVDESIVTAQPPPLRYRAGEGERQRASAGPLPPEKPVFAAQRPVSGNQSLRSQPPFAGRGGGDEPPAVSHRHYLEIKDDIRELREMIRTVLDTAGNSSKTGTFAGGWAVLHRRLLDSEVSAAHASGLIAALQKEKGGQGGAGEKELGAVLEGYFPVAGPIRLPGDRPYVVAFVGPTGGGKTTTLAKLAAHLAVNKNKGVSLLSADTYRIAAIDQIRAFADIVNIGLQVVFAPDELPQALAGCENDDIILVDTAGRSQANAGHMQELERFLAALKPDEVHLVLSASTKDSDLRAAVERYRPLGVNRLLFTKLDETATLGNVFNTVADAGIAVSYFATGQEIPDDIELAQPARFVQRLWERNRR